MDFKLKTIESNIPFSERATMDTYWVIIAIIAAILIYIGISVAISIKGRSKKLGLTIFLCFGFIFGAWIYSLAVPALNKTLPPPNKGYYQSVESYQVVEVKRVNAGFEEQKVMRDKIKLIKGSNHNRYWTLTLKPGAHIKEGDRVILRTQEMWIGKKAEKIYHANEEDLTKEYLRQGLREDKFKYQLLVQ